jgi:hypothetical protein
MVVLVTVMMFVMLWFVLLAKVLMKDFGLEKI